ncbi:hypothetical protein B7P43_G03519 [Cryptotermes secundus]|uniref:Uncharacterized protein n=1 Tax=Cryptotermes secundus TaxID=105785 RepID=A0A2J7R573_9NEOP|nr:hypothetical protein B7P43_G03519 [Cryptotermes secundus]
MGEIFEALSMAKNVIKIFFSLSPSQPIKILTDTILRASDLSSSLRWDKAGVRQ